MPTKCVECSFLIPVHRDQNLSDGLAHGRRAYLWLRERLFDFGGMTQGLELYDGWYIDPDTKEQVNDRSRKYYVAIERKELGKLRELLREACLVFHQKCIYLNVAGAVEFIARPKG